LRVYIDKSGNQVLNGSETRALSILIYIVSLLCENCDFDRLSDEREGISRATIVYAIAKSFLQDIRAELDSVSPVSHSFCSCAGLKVVHIRVLLRSTFTTFYFDCMASIRTRGQEDAFCNALVSSV
jgi:hypothetical protein